jgi:predicted RNA binding protein YcfA (HicA-like mRNA interferase family)
VKLPRGLSGSEVVKALGLVGWRWVRTRGSHAMLQKDGRDFTLAVPLHDQMGPGLLRGILRDAGLKVAEFVALTRQL